MRTLLVLGVLAACGGSGRQVTSVPVPADAPPGTRWITPTQPWRVTGAGGGLIVAGNVALVPATGHGVIEEIDLTTGARLREHALGKQLRVTAFTRLDDGRYLLAGEHDDVTEAAILDPATFKAAWFTLPRLTPDAEAYATAGAIELADHSIVIVGPDLPLAIYDAHTLARTRVLGELPSWTDPHATATTLFARNKGAQFEIDLASGASRPHAQAVIAATRTAFIERSYEKGSTTHRLVTPTTTRTLPSTLGYSATFDAEGTRILSLRAGVVTVYAATDGSVLGRFDLWPQAPWSANMVFAGDKLVISTSATVQIADLVTKSMTTLDAPYGPYTQLAVDDDGAVVAIGPEVWRYVDGRLASTASRGKLTALVDAPPAGWFATRTSRPFEPGLGRGKFPSAITVKTIEGRLIRELSLPRETDGAWLGEGGRIVASYKWEVDVPQKLVITSGNQLADITSYHLDATIDDVDVDAGIAAFSLGGTTTLLAFADHAQTKVVSPRCAEYATVQLERHGGRVLVYDGNDLLLWDRTTGKAVGTAHFTEPPSDAMFLPGERELLILLDDRLAWWDPATNATRTVALPGLAKIAVSKDHRHAALALADSRLALVDYAVLRAAATAGPTLAKVAVPGACSTRDPFDLADPEEPATEDHDDHADDQDDDSEGNTGDTGD